LNSGGPEAVLEFWFRRDEATGELLAMKQWFSKDPEFDDAVRRTFGDLMQDARAGSLDWRDSPRASLAQIVVLDQFFRNAWRDTPEAFAGDSQALRLADALVSCGGDATLEPLERVFAYLPFEHAESAAEQDRSVALFESLLRHGPQFKPYLDFAIRHREVIRRFGRFPHRNRILGRPSSAQESHYLAQPGSGF